MHLIQALEIDLLEILDSLRCLCGGEKSKHSVLCHPCYRRLPLALRKSLALTVSKSLGEAYREAEQWLLDPERRISGVAESDVRNPYAVERSYRCQP